MRRVLYEYKITGLKTNLSYLKRIMHTPDFVKGEYNTLFIEKNSRMLLRGNGNNEEIENIAMIASYIDYLMNLEEIKQKYGNTYWRPRSRCDVGEQGRKQGTVYD